MFFFPSIAFNVTELNQTLLTGKKMSVKCKNRRVGFYVEKAAVFIINSRAHTHARVLSTSSAYKPGKSNNLNMSNYYSTTIYKSSRVSELQPTRTINRNVF